MSRAYEFHRGRLVAAVVAVMALHSGSCGGTAQQRTTYGSRPDLKTPPRALWFSPGRYGIEVAENKLRVLVVPDLGSNLIEVGVRYKVGSIDDPEGKAGLAHMVEHMMFEQRAGGEDQPSIGEQLAQVAVWNNAFTDYEWTQYMAVAHRSQLAALVELEAQRMRTDCSSFAQRAFEREREVVRNELRQRERGSLQRSYPTLLQAIYAEGHPYRRTVGGDDAQLSTLTLEDVCAFIEQHYVPANAIVVISGNVTRQDVDRVIDAHLSAVPARDAAPRPEVSTVDAVNLSSTRASLAVDEQAVYFAWPVPPPYTSERTRADLGLLVIETQARKLAVRQPVPGTVESFTIGGERSPAHVIAVHLHDDDDGQTARKIMTEAYEQASKWFDEEDLFGAKIDSLQTRYRDLDPFFGRTFEYASYLQFDRALSLVVGENDRLQAQKPAQVAADLSKLYALSNAAVVHVAPADDGPRPAARAELELEGMDPLGAYRRPFVNAAEADAALTLELDGSALARARRFTLDNGLEVVMLRVGYAPIVQVDLLLRSGHADEPAEQPGLANLAANLLGPGKGSEDQVMTPGAVGADIYVFTSREVTRISSRGLSAFVDFMLEGTARLVHEGVYDQKALERLRAALRREMQDEDYGRSAARTRAVFAALYGADHPYARLAAPTERSLARLSVDALQRYRERHFTARNATLIVTGRFDSDVVEQHIRAHFAALHPGHANRRTRPEGALRGSTFRGAAPTDDGELIDVLIAYGSEAGIDEDYAARLVLAEMLDARMSTLRETLGLSYGVDATFVVDGGLGRFVVSGSVDHKRAGEALAAMRAGLSMLRSGETFAEDFVYARRRVAQRTLHRSASSASVAADLAWIEELGGPSEHYERLVATIAGLTPDDVRRVLDSELAEGREAIVLRGAEQAIREAYAAIGVQAYERLD